MCLVLLLVAFSDMANHFPAVRGGRPLYLGKRRGVPARKTLGLSATTRQENTGDWSPISQQRRVWSAVGHRSVNNARRQWHGDGLGWCGLFSTGRVNGLA